MASPVHPPSLRPGYSPIFDPSQSPSASTMLLRDDLYLRDRPPKPPPRPSKTDVPSVPHAEEKYYLSAEWSRRTIPFPVPRPILPPKPPRYEPVHEEQDDIPFSSSPPSMPVHQPPPPLPPKPSSSTAQSLFFQDASFLRVSPSPGHSYLSFNSEPPTPAVHIESTAPDSSHSEESTEPSFPPRMSSLPASSSRRAPPRPLALVLSNDQTAISLGSAALSPPWALTAGSNVIARAQEDEDAELAQAIRESLLIVNHDPATSNQRRQTAPPMERPDSGYATDVPSSPSRQKRAHYPPKSILPSPRGPLVKAVSVGASVPNSSSGETTPLADSQGSEVPKSRLRAHSTIGHSRSQSDASAMSPVVPPQSREWKLDPYRSSAHFDLLSMNLMNGVCYGFGSFKPFNPLQPQTHFPDVVTLNLGETFYICAPSFRHLLRLLASLDHSTFEAAHTAQRTLKSSELLLRPTLQFFRIRQKEHLTIMWVEIASLPESPSSPLPPSHKLDTSRRPPMTSLPPSVQHAPNLGSQLYVCQTPLPSLPRSLPDVANYLQTLLQDSRAGGGISSLSTSSSNDGHAFSSSSSSSSGLKRLAKLVDSIYGKQQDVIPDGVSVSTSAASEGGRWVGEVDRTRRVKGMLAKVIMASGRKKEKEIDETYDMVTPFRLNTG